VGGWFISRSLRSVSTQRSRRGGLAGGRVDAGSRSGRVAARLKTTVLVDLAVVSPFLDRLAGPQASWASPAGCYASRDGGLSGSGSAENTFSSPAGRRALSERCLPAMGVPGGVAS